MDHIWLNKQKPKPHTQIKKQKQTPSVSTWIPRDLVDMTGISEKIEDEV
jgi:hypothetical protein